MRSLITGGTGFVGQHLARHLIGCGDEVTITTRAATQDKYDLPAAVNLVQVDVADNTAVNNLIDSHQPEAVYHLAAIAFVPEAEANPSKVFDVNFFGTFNVLQAVETLAPKARVLAVGSSEVYGAPGAEELPIVERSELRPISNYGVSKCAADLMAGKYAHSNKVEVVRARPFPHLGRGQDSRFALSSFSQQIAQIKNGGAEPVISVGNLQAKRDYTDVADIVRGYRQMLIDGTPGEAYNLCSGRSVEIAVLLERLITLSGVDVEIRQDPQRMRASDIPEVRGSFAKAQQAFGWQPADNLDAVLLQMLEQW